MVYCRGKLPVLRPAGQKGRENAPFRDIFGRKEQLFCSADERNIMSSNSEYAIQVQDVSKIYKLYDKPIDRLKESLSLTHKNYHKDFFALSDISFNVKKGETVGIIGTNGSGKSTILKIITGVLTPTSGQVRVS